MNGLVELTPDQQAIAGAAADERLLVTAGPGTGKTHTLTARLLHLVEQEGLMPGAEVLVLSFSRAAVREIRERLTGLGSAAFVRVSTFDSFATRLLAEVEPDGSWQNRSYDGRIAAADQAIRSGACEDALSDLRHVVIDEAQDLVGVRADLVAALLRRRVCGFTVFGDPAQGIYDFQLRDTDTRRPGSGRLYDWVRSEFSDLIERSLDVNFRARTDAARAAVGFGPLLNSPGADFGSIRRGLETVLLAAPTLGIVVTAIPALRRSTARTAVLCRTNGEALTVSETLWSEGIPHRLRQSSTDRQVGRWIADALATSSARTVSRTAVLSALADVELPAGMDVESAWSALKRLDRRDRRRTDDLDLGHVAAHIRSGDLPDDLTAPPDDLPLVVSTIHRAKGLEFDRVVVVEPSDRGIDLVEAEESRTLYVALTRPRDELFHIEPIDTNRLSRGPADDRWVRRGWKSWQRFGMEVRGDDTDPSVPGGASDIGDLAATQKYIATNVQRGDPVELRLRLDRVDDDERSFYDLYHDGRIVGTTRPGFGRDLFRVLKISRKWTVHFPRSIKGLRVQDIDTGAGTEAEGVRSGLGPSGLWLRVRVGGIGAFDFQENS